MAHRDEHRTAPQGVNTGLAGVIDVVIPTYNRLWALPRVAAFYLRRPEVRRVIVVNDGSTDGSRQWLEDEARRGMHLTCVHLPTNLGPSAARNAGAREATAPLVFFADDDMLPVPDEGLVIMSREMEAQDADIAAPLHILPESAVLDGLPSIAASAAGAPPLFHRHTLELCSRSVLAATTFPASVVTPLACGVMLMRRAVLDRVSYDETLGTSGYRDETDFQLKAIAAGFRMIACVRPVLVDLTRTRDGGGCRASTTPIGYEWRACRNNWKVLRRHRGVIRDRLGIRAPILYMQGRFVAAHVVGRLARHYVGQALRRWGLR